MEKVIIYLHGFLSSPQSQKAQQTVKYMQQNWPELRFEVPQIPPYPEQAIAHLESLVAKYKTAQLGFIGSSLGGYLATYLQEKYSGKAVLINPAVKPYELLSDYLGEHVNPYNQQAFLLEDCHTRQLKNLRTAQLAAPEKYWVLLQTADETLDYRQAEQKYTGSKLTIEQGGDHSFQGFERFLPDIISFLLEND